MSAKLSLTILAVLLVVQIWPSYGNPTCCSKPCLSPCEQVILPVPLPSKIPIAKVCTCRTLALRPTLLPCASPCSPLKNLPLDPLLLPSCGLPEYKSYGCEPYGPYYSPLKAPCGSEYFPYYNYKNCKNLYPCGL